MKRYGSYDEVIRAARVRQLEELFASSSERLAPDPAMRAIVGRRGWTRRQCRPATWGGSKLGDW